MCYGMNCPHEGSNGTCGYGPDYPCKEPKKILITFDIQTTLERYIDLQPNQDIWDSVKEYIDSPEFYDDLKQQFLTNGEIEWEVTL